ncbi:MAG TPA: hypothetical protein VGG29_07755 [Caulobacteraceae bacterium]|jgi:hypothetical protein
MSAKLHALDAPAAETFQERGYVVAPALIDPGLRAFLWTYVQTRFASQLLGPGGQVAPGSLGAYADPAFEGLLEFLRPAVEGLTGLRLHPTYSFFRLYRRGNALRRHRDRPACEVSVSLAIGQAPAEPWPLWLDGGAGPYGARLAPGDALVYRGVDLAHWREPFEGEQLVQVFLHYVDRDGPYADERFDRRPTLMRPGDESS